MGWLILVLLADVLITGSFSPLIFISAAILHEAGHIVCMRLCRVPIRRIGFVGFGILIENNARPPIGKEICIYLSGPAVNLTAAVIFYFVYIFCDAPSVLSFAFANGLYFFLNVLPIPPLDGYHVLDDFLCLRYSFVVSRRIGKGISVLFLISIICFTVAVARQGRVNYSLLLVTAALVVNETVYIFS